MTRRHIAWLIGIFVLLVLTARNNLRCSATPLQSGPVVAAERSEEK